MRRTRNAKIVSTLGPASSTEASIAELFEAGTDVFRLNFSHGTHADHKSRLDIIRRLEGRFDRPIGVMLDLQGPKLRVGDIVGGSVELTDGMPYRLDLTGEQGDARRAPLPHPEIFASLKADMDLLIDDGKIRLRVTECGAEWAETRVVIGGTLSDHKGVNVPSAVLDLSPLTEKDHRDLRFGLELGVDWVALSFVQRPDDVAEARKIVGGKAGILVKLEKPSAIDHLDGIIELADALMVARGDLGVEMPPEDVPGLQKRIIRACRHAGKPVVVATQMLESMIHAPTPTRAEASDVATAVYDGADAVMLSAETAAGEYPVESVAMMDRIVNRVERDPLYRTILEAERYDPEETAADAITAAARQVARTIGASAIVTFTTTGSTTLRAARERPPVPILGLTPRGDTARRLSLVWSVHSLETVDLKDFREMVSKAVDIAVREGFAITGDRLVITAGVPFGTPGATNILRIAWAE
ncbi:MAG: pyruvate kinase [Rhodospirillales bacterium]|jgi:pyruvate kinase|nr:pyruvate kinase [Rhodospirillales bacterium]MDP7650641.1 pyruvate kinase [Rhodospirillales bacterium]